MHASSQLMHMVQVQGPAAQTRDREYQPICSSKTFTTITDQPCQKEVRACLHPISHGSSTAEDVRPSASLQAFTVSEKLAV